MGFKDRFLKFMGIKKKIPQEPGVIGFYDSKPFDSLKWSLIYANEILISESDDEKTAKVMIYTREYKKTTFINVLVYKEEGFEISNYTYEKLKPLLIEKGIKPAEKSIVLVIFQHRNENTIEMAHHFCKSDKLNFEQALVYNPKRVQMDYYKPVPTFYKLYDIMCEDLYFDLAFIDSIRE